jgi:hypothetical protein
LSTSCRRQSADQHAKYAAQTGKEAHGIHQEKAALSTEKNTSFDKILVAMVSVHALVRNVDVWCLLLFVLRK